MSELEETRCGLGWATYSGLWVIGGLVAVGAAKLLERLLPLPPGPPGGSRPVGVSRGL